MRSTNETVPWKGHRTTTGAVLTEPAEYKDRIVRSKLRVIGDSATHIPGYLPRRQEPYQSPKMHTYRGTPEAFGRSVTICTYVFFFVVFPVRSDARDVVIAARTLYLQADTLKLDVELDSLFSRRALDAIESGLITSVAMEFRLDSDRQSKALEFALGMRLDHDIWEGRYRVVRDTGRLDTLQTAHFDAVRNFCSVLHGLALGPLPDGRNFQLRLRVGVTPISIEQEQRSRRWLNVLQKGSLLELFFSLDRPTKRTPWIEVSRFSPEDLQ